MSKKTAKKPREMTTDEAVARLFSGKALKHVSKEVAAGDAKKKPTKR